MISKYFEWVLHQFQCLQNHTRNFEQKIIPKTFKNKGTGKAIWSQPFAGNIMQPTSQTAGFAPIANLFANVMGKSNL